MPSVILEPHSRPDLSAMSDLLLQGRSTVNLLEGGDHIVTLQSCSMAAAKDQADREPTPIGSRILFAAKEAGFTQSSLERAAQFSGGYLTKLIYNPQDRIEISKLERLCDLLGVRMHWLATGREPMREGGILSPAEQAMIHARELGVTEDVFWFVRGRDAEEPEAEHRNAAAWLSAYLEENKRRVNDASYARESKRIAMYAQRHSKKMAVPSSVPAEPDSKPVPKPKKRRSA